MREARAGAHVCTSTSDVRCDLGALWGGSPSSCLHLSASLGAAPPSGPRPAAYCAGTLSALPPHPLRKVGT